MVSKPKPQPSVDRERAAKVGAATIRVRGSEVVREGDYLVHRDVHPRWLVAGPETVIVDADTWFAAHGLARRFLGGQGVAEPESCRVARWRPPGVLPAKVALISAGAGGELVVERFDFGALEGRGGA